jgi:hypothetical protein
MSELIQLRRHYKVVLVKALDLLRLQRHRYISPAEADVGVVTFSFRQITSAFCESKRLCKVFELERSLDSSTVVAYRPFGCMATVGLHLIFIERRNPTTARGARLVDEGLWL